MEEGLTVGILREIRDEIRSTRQELKGELAETRRELGERIDQTNLRLGNVETAVLEMAGQQRFVVRYLKALSARDRSIETDVEELKGRVEVLEEKSRR